MNDANSDIKTDKKNAKIIFWCLTPLLFPIAVRINQAMLFYVIGTLVVMAIGQKYGDIIAIITLVLAFVISIIQYKYFYRYYKKYFIEG
jgi:hypothetical protein